MFLIFTCVWYTIGFIGCLGLMFLQDESIRVDDLLGSMWLGLLGPIGVGFVAYFIHGNLVIYRKKQ